MRSFCGDWYRLSKLTGFIVGARPLAVGRPRTESVQRGDGLRPGDWDGPLARREHGLRPVREIYFVGKQSRQNSFASVAGWARTDGTRSWGSTERAW